jgi:hypothetical protein
MGDARENPVEQDGLAPATGQGPRSGSGHWKPVLTLLVLSPAIGELLSGSSPPLQFFNPLFFLLLLGLYGCGALLVRETLVRRGLNAAGVLLLGAAYAIIEEGLTCKSFFNPYWTDTGFLSIYGRALGVNWAWTFGLTFYHMAVSITVPIFLTEALFPLRARAPWLRRRGLIMASVALALVTVLGFLGFDNRQFHLIEMKNPLELARQLEKPNRPLTRFISEHLRPKSAKLVGQAVTAQAASPELTHALQEELNRVLPRSDLYSPERFADIALPEDLKQQAARSPQGDKLIEFNRALLERALPESVAARQSYPFRPAWWLILGCVVAILGLVLLALRQTRSPRPSIAFRRPWLTGLGFTGAFVLIGFVLPSLIEHGMRIPAALDCVVWVLLATLLGRILNRMDGASDRTSRRGLWALGIITPWVFFALLLGVFVGMIGAKSFFGMPLVSLAFGAGILGLGLKWRKRLEPRVANGGPGPGPVRDSRPAE